LRECLFADAGLSFDGGALQVGSDDFGLLDMAAPGIADGGKGQLQRESRPDDVK